VIVQGKDSTNPQVPTFYQPPMELTLESWQTAVGVQCDNRIRDFVRTPSEAGFEVIRVKHDDLGACLRFKCRSTGREGRFEFDEFGSCRMVYEGTATRSRSHPPRRRGLASSIHTPVHQSHPNPCQQLHRRRLLTSFREPHILELLENAAIGAIRPTELQAPLLR
jgi:hypothetical protein